MEVAGLALVLAGIALGVTRADKDRWAAEAARMAEQKQGARMRLNSMRGLDVTGLMRSGNVRAFLAVIRDGEGTADDGGYSRLYGGGQFEGWSDHPRTKVKRWGITSTAAGAYQLLASSWDETAALMNLADFSPRSQDAAALGRIAARGALPDVLAGNLAAAISKTNKEWASLPGSPYGQRTNTLDRARLVYLQNGGREGVAA